jgi:hypothetical protein
VIGVKSLVVVGIVGATLGFTVIGHDLALDTLSAASAFAIGLFASGAAALIAFGWRPDLPSRAALAVARGRARLVVDLASGAGVRELPAFIQLALFVIAFGAVGLRTFDNVTTARIASVPASLSEPSHAEYCGVEPAAKVPDAAPEPAIEQPVDQAGCALVKRAVELGYKKELGNCAPKVVKPVSPAIEREREVCTKRQLDEPFLHFMVRKLLETSSDASPVASLGTYVEDFRTRTGYVGDFLADIRNSVTGAPHASHHIYVNLPDPHPGSWLDRFTGHEPCTGRFAHLPLWPRWTKDTPPGAVFEHVLGQLLFATRFGTPASCSDYTIHWNAAADTCTKLAANPAAVLDETDALDPIRGVLDRRKRQLALRALAVDLKHPPTLPEPPPARYVTSVACFVVGQPPSTSGRDVTLDGEPIALREVHAPAVNATGAGPIDLYVQLGILFGGTPYAGPAQSKSERIARDPVEPDAEFPLLSLEPVADADPFVGNTAALSYDVMFDVYPFELHLFAFVDAFRRAYLPQRGRL